MVAKMWSDTRAREGPIEQGNTINSVKRQF